MSDLERRSLIHLLDGQQLLLAFAVRMDDRVTHAAYVEWDKEKRRLRVELEDAIMDESKTHSEGWDQ